MENRYQRQICLKKIGIKGQERLLKAKVAIIGCGALGTSVANNLARAGIGYIRLIDGDTVAVSNLHRQQIFTEDDARKKRNKAEVTTDFLLSANSEIKVNSFPYYLNQNNASLALSDIDLIIDATDNFETRMLINDLAIRNIVPWVHGAALGFEGRVVLFQPNLGCYRCLVPLIPGNDIIPRPEKFGVFGPLASIIGSIQATEAVKYILNSEGYYSSLISIDIWHNQMQVVDFRKNTNCLFCGNLN